MRGGHWSRQIRLIGLLLLCMALFAVNAPAESGDNSLASLGILTEGVKISPEFYYSTIEYQVLVPQGTQELELSPLTSSPGASVVSITGTTLENSSGTVAIQVEAENGAPVTYYLYVSPDPDSVPPETETESETPTETEKVTETEKETEPVTEAPTEPETEDPRFVKVLKSSLEEADTTISRLKDETSRYRERLDLMMKILYALIGFCVLLLFVIINLIIRRRDLKKELRQYQQYAQQAGAAYGNGEEYWPQNEAGYQSGQEDDNTAQQEWEEYPQNGAWEEYPQNDMYEEYPQDGAYEEYPQESGYEDGAQISRSLPEEQAGTGTIPADMSANAENAAADDPSTVPRPELSRKVPKSMPSYEKTGKAPRYQSRKPDENAKDVEVTMIDL